MAKSPLYIKISELIKKQIDSGYFIADQLLPSEAEIQQQYNVSRVTVRAAYKRLNEMGIIRTVQGKGTYVNNIREKDWSWMRHFTSEIHSLGREPSSIILVFKQIPADDEIAEKLNIGIKTPVFYIKRLRCIDNYPVWLTKSYIPVNIAETLTKEFFSIKGMSQSIFFVLEHDFGIDFEAGYEGDIEDSPSVDDLDMLGLTEGDSYAYKNYISKNSLGIPVVYEKTVIASRYREKRM